MLFVGNCFKEIIYLPEGIFKELLMLITSEFKKKCMKGDGEQQVIGEPLESRGERWGKWVGVPGVLN